MCGTSIALKIDRSALRFDGHWLQRHLSAMPWEPYSVHFKQLFTEGYRYLDKCGEFLLSAAKAGVIPGEVKPTGGQITVPELRIHGHVSTTDIALRQDLPVDNFSAFFEKVSSLVELAHRHFGPLDVQSNGFAGKWYCAARSPEQAAALSLRFKEPKQDALAKSLDMVPEAAQVDWNFASGSTTLHVVVQPVAFENISTTRHNVPIRATRDQKDRVRRLNEAQRGFDVSHALMLDVDLVEFDPPSNATLEKHFALFEAKAKVLTDLLEV